MTAIPYKAIDGNTYLLETLPGGDGVNPVRALPPTDSTNIALTASQLATVITALSGMASSLSTLATSNASLLAANDPGIGLTSQINALNTTHQDGPDLAAALGVWAQNISTGTQIVTIRYKAQGNATATTGWRLMTPGAEHFFPCTNANQLSFISSAAGAEVGLHAI